MRFLLRVTGQLRRSRFPSAPKDDYLTTRAGARISAGTEEAGGEPGSCSMPAAGGKYVGLGREPAACPPEATATAGRGPSQIYGTVTFVGGKGACFVAGIQA
jgi:hypothetical protein